MPELTSLFLKRAVRDLQKLRDEAEQQGSKLALLAYLIDMALVEAQEQASEGKPPQLQGK